jgi:hypothetical protein
MPLVRMFDMRRKTPNTRILKLGFLKRQDELQSSEEVENQIATYDIPVVAKEVNKSKRRQMRLYLRENGYQRRNMPSNV